MIIRPYIEIKSIGPDGDVLQHIEQRPCRSFVKNYYHMIVINMTGADGSVANDLNLLDTGGNSRVFDAPIPSLEAAVQAGSGIENRGIIVGSSTDAEAFGESDEARSYSIGTAIAHGTGAGQLSYQAMANPVVAKTGVGVKTWTTPWLRLFNNNSGGSIIVREVCLYFYDSYSFQIVRELLDSPYLTVADSGQLSVTISLVLGTPA